MTNPAAPAGFGAFCQGLLEELAGAGWRVATERGIPYGRTFDLLDQGGGRAVLNCYFGKKGFRWVAAGQRAAELQGALGGEPKAPAAASSNLDPFSLGWPRVGADESGKGDYFGPLAVAAFLADEKTGEELVAMGVADSKRLSDPAVVRLAGKLEETGLGEAIVLMPREYNPAWRRTGNLNLLLAEQHGRCIRRLVERTGAQPEAVLVDQFARDQAPLRRALEAPLGRRLSTRTKGEADPAVAAASILARAAFLDGLKALEVEFGQEFPPGAGSPVLKAGRAFVRSFGAERLADVAKTHFATTAKLT